MQEQITVDNFLKSQAKIQGNSSETAIETSRLGQGVSAPSPQGMTDAEYHFRLMEYYQRINNNPFKYKERRRKLLAMKKFINQQKDAIIEAIRRDFKRPVEEIYLTEINPILAELNHTLKHLKKWVAAKRISSPLTLWGTKSYVFHQPVGVVLILSPWNYPMALAINPLIAAIAAGNRIILKPSEFTPFTSKLIKDMCDSLFSPEEIKVFEGGVDMAKELTALPFNHLFFTGNTQVGAQLIQQSANHFTGLTLELGGKSPCLLDRGIDLKSAAKKIAWGKFTNAGQTCVAPDYILCPREDIVKLTHYLEIAIAQLYGSDENARLNNDDYGAIVNLKHFSRLKNLLDEVRKEAVAVEVGGICDRQSRKITPTVISHVKPESILLKDEIFGPILPILAYDNLDQAFNYMAQKPRPLAFYFFSKDDLKIQQALNKSISGGMVVNDVLIHLANTNLPFGGVNHSGFGQYHGEYGFKSLTHPRATVIRNRKGIIQTFFPPYTGLKKSAIRFLSKFLNRFL